MIALTALVLLMMAITSVAAFDLVILHTNDFHDRIEEINQYSGSCSPKDSEDGKCFGGVARIQTKVKELRSKYPNSILLDAGDQYQGTLWFFKFGGIIHSSFMNLIGYDAMGIGNHEFDNGVSGLVPFVTNATFSVLSANIDLSKTPQLQGKIERSAKITVGGETIGVIGYTTKTTNYISNTETVSFTDELTAVQAEADKLMADGVNKIIAVGHQGFSEDQDMAKSLKGVDVIVGGHTNTFLYTGDEPSNEESVGPYPFVVKTSTSGDKVLIVQDYAFGKYLGSLHVTFDDAGKITSHSGNPILLDKSVAKDPELQQRVESLLPQIEALKDQPVGSTHVLLQGDRNICRVRECNLGNLISDGMVQQNLRHSDDEYWSDVGIAVVNSGGIRSSLAIGPITYGDVIKVHPFKNTVDIVELRGETVLKMLEHSASQWTDKDGDKSGAFLQFSGMRVVYDTTQPPMHRVVDVQMKCSKCKIPEFEPLKKKQVYQILMNEFMLTGKDGFTMISDEMVKRHIIGNVDLDILVETIKQNSPVIQGLDGRIRFLQDVKADSLYLNINTTEPCVTKKDPLLETKGMKKSCVADAAQGISSTSPLAVLIAVTVELWVSRFSFMM